MVSNLQVEGKKIDSAMMSWARNRRLELENLQRQLKEEQEAAQKASEQGDRSENAEWQIANDNIAKLMVRIVSLTGTIDLYEKYSSSYTPTGKVTIGSTLKLRDITRNSTLYIKIFPPGLGNANICAISAASPVGAAVMDKTAKTEVTVKAPIGDIPYYIEEVL